ncbi:uncharacterized protein LOC112588286 [Harpegnathos saltator]|uniref:uncharacterized protein LOC112588286 n=1 Tax=Harpegnathos saltator TaxID=610380 RepID=UPI000DBEDE32|nr:uncharacterized protein LOC112588286 [Harpegnathos saltator]
MSQRITRWFGDDMGSVAIIWRASENSRNLYWLRGSSHYGRGIPPPDKNLDLIGYGSRLQEIGDAIQRHLPGPVIVAGDFNAKSELWGSRRGDRRGEVTLDWAAGLGLHVLNEGTKSTFVGSQGESIIDLSWATPAALRRVRTWRVADELETLSDHQLIEMELSVTPDGLRPNQSKEPRPGRWSLAQLNKEILEISLESSTWPRQREEQDLDSEVMEAMDIHRRVMPPCPELGPAQNGPPGGGQTRSPRLGVGLSTSGGPSEGRKIGRIWTLRPFWPPGRSSAVQLQNSGMP